MGERIPPGMYMLSAREFDAAFSVICAEGWQVKLKSTGGDYDV
jgi:hypothetical protein